MAKTELENEHIQRSQKGDHAAFGLLVQAHQKMIHSLTYRMTGSESEAEDLAQETFIQAYQSIDRFRGESSFSSWLYRIAINVCLNWRKRESRRNKLLDQWLPEAPEQPRRDQVRSAQVQPALLKLPQKQRAAIVLTICEGLSHAEAALALGCSETTVSWRVFVAKRKLRHSLERPSHE
jgi:RNA polymerase sigma-70 factor (ECF subfamily)